MEYATPEQISDRDVIGELRFTTVKESVNIYEIQKVLNTNCYTSRQNIHNKQERLQPIILLFGTHLILA